MEYVHELVSWELTILLQSGCIRMSVVGLIRLSRWMTSTTHLCPCISVHLILHIFQHMRGGTLCRVEYCGDQLLFSLHIMCVTEKELCSSLFKLILRDRKMSIFKRQALSGPSSRKCYAAMRTPKRTKVLALFCEIRLCFPQSACYKIRYICEFTFG
ncbi:hypothetical protein Taro_013093 [Colocasia esculenta]|uniref:Uncharacterized protein n=1 Tax=Colocasia esculenta TaxID=4460 RepID=A0A843UHQ9_COLES|nr:hypothetical protein [Colocasia esculenta]